MHNRVGITNALNELELGQERIYKSSTKPRAKGYVLEILIARLASVWGRGRGMWGGRLRGTRHVRRHFGSHEANGAAKEREMKGKPSRAGRGGARRGSKTTYQRPVA